MRYNEQSQAEMRMNAHKYNHDHHERHEKSALIRIYRELHPQPQYKLSMNQNDQTPFFEAGPVLVGT